jgi:hypothetical protein
MTKYEDFIHKEIDPLLKEGESIEALGFLYNKSLASMVMFGAITLLGGGYFFAAATQDRLFLIATEMGFTSLKMANKELVQIPYSTIRAINSGGFLNQKTIKFHLTDGKVEKFRLNTLTYIIKGQGKFIKTLQTLHRQFVSR